MKPSRIAQAVSAAVGAGASCAALAAPLGAADSVMYLSGASSLGITVAKSLDGLCSAAGGNLTIYQTAGVVDQTTTLENTWTAVCSVPFINGALREVRANLGGSATAATAALGTGGSLQYLENTFASSSLGQPRGSLGFLANGELRLVPASGLGSPSTLKSNGGFLLMEPPVLKALGVTGLDGVLADTTEFQAAFGVAVSQDLYLLLQAHQVATGLLPHVDGQGNVCGTASGATTTASGDTHPGCQPSISLAQLTSLASNINSLAKRGGVNFLLGSTNGAPPPLSLAPVAAPPAGTRLTYVRRDPRSGVFACSTIASLNNPTGTTAAVGGSLSAGGSSNPATSQSIGTTFGFYTTTGLADTVRRLNTPTSIPSVPSSFALGVLTLENNPIGTQDRYRFVKLQRNFIAEGVSGSGQSAEAIAGRYGFNCEVLKYGDGSTASAVLLAIENGIAVGNASPGVFRSDESAFSRGKLKLNTQPFTVYRPLF